MFFGLTTPLKRSGPFWVSMIIRDEIGHLLNSIEYNLTIFQLPLYIHIILPSAFRFGNAYRTRVESFHTCLLPTVVFRTAHYRFVLLNISRPDSWHIWIGHNKILINGKRLQKLRFLVGGLLPQLDVLKLRLVNILHFIK